MPIPEHLRGLFTDPSFWSAYLAEPDGSAVEHHAEVRVSLPVAGGYGLVLEIDLGYGECLLGLRQPGATEPVPLARLDPARPYAAVLRWAELDLIGQVVAMDDPSWSHPGLVVALLHRYAPPTGDSRARRRAATMVATALRSLRRAPGAVAVAPVGPQQPPLDLFTDPSWWPSAAPVDPRVFDDDAVARQVRDHLDHGERLRWRYAPGWGWVVTEAPPGAGADVGTDVGTDVGADVGATPGVSADDVGAADVGATADGVTTARVLGAESFPFDQLDELVGHAAARHARLFDTPWRDAQTVLPLARRIRETGDLSAVPALGKALQDAGWDHPTVLDALTEPLVPAESAWVVDALLGIGPALDDGR
ncbi:hypothetical protein O7632_02910 [Solwaraspora sp. WMMD406]|uniref:hypothetical protein n=1 Tax=Solwaraspora sp. WMMD406 TaxID=3016095 RepID=UPI0024162214|nr:hypothetical protein [Solwaraspora sp. WMMD406]MDG4763065.1 hypothetical protein [Solwaraspora sp. WMMD406]